MNFEQNTECKTQEYTGSWAFMTTKKLFYWGYRLPRLGFDANGKKEVYVSSFWTPTKCDVLHAWLDNQELLIRRYLKPDAVVTWYQNMRERVKSKKRYPEEEAERVQLEADNWRRSLVGGGEKYPVDVRARKMMRPQSDTAILDLAIRGLIDRPDDYFMPPVIVGMFLDPSNKAHVKWEYRSTRT